MADGSPSLSSTESRRTIIEARVAGGWERIASCTEPAFWGNRIVLERVVVSPIFQFALHPIPVEVWLAKKMLAVTNILETSGRHSTTSWVVEFESCDSVSELVPGTNVFVLHEARFIF